MHKSHITHHTYGPAKSGILGDWLRRPWVRCWRWSSGPWCYLWWRGRWCRFCGIRWRCGGKCPRWCMNCRSLFYTTTMYSIYTEYWYRIEQCGLPHPNRERCRSGSATSGWGCWTGTVTKQHTGFLRYQYHGLIYHTGVRSPYYTYTKYYYYYCSVLLLLLPLDCVCIESSLAGRKNADVDLPPCRAEANHGWLDVCTPYCVKQ